MAKPRNGEDVLAHDIYWHRQAVTALLECWNHPDMRPLFSDEDRAKILNECKRLLDAVAEPDRRAHRELAEERRQALRNNTILGIKA